MKKVSVLFVLFCGAVWVAGVEAQHAEPTLEPIPLPEPKAQMQAQEPTPAVKRQGATPVEPSDVVEPTTYEIAPVAEEPMVIEGPGQLGEFAAESEPPIILHGNTIPGTGTAPQTLAPPSVQPPVVERTIPQRETRYSIAPPVEPPRYSDSADAVARPPQLPPHCVRRQYVQPRNIQPRFYQPVAAPQSQAIVRSALAGVRYDAAGRPYSVQQTTQYRPGPGHFTTQVTTYEISRYRPVRYEVAVPATAGRVYVVPAGYSVRLAPAPPSGPIRTWLRRL